jgi:hypothetical protein
VTIIGDMDSRLDEHWALRAIGPNDVSLALDQATRRLVEWSLRSALSARRATIDESLIRRVATAYEIAAAETMSAVLHPAGGTENREAREMAEAAASRAFELRRVLPATMDAEEEIFRILHVAALGYAGDRWSDVRRWIREQGNQVESPSLAEVPWDRRLLYRIYDGWIRLLRKDGWNDLAEVSAIIAGLRADQAEYEANVLEGAGAGQIAYRLIALYHWAKATELIATYMMQGEPAAIAEELDQHFEAGVEAALASSDPTLELLLRWLHLASRRMAAGSLWAAASGGSTVLTDHARNLTRRGFFELLPPQRIALREQGLLDPASRAVVVDMPTSGGKTLLAEFRIIQALNQFREVRGWVAYVAPTRALVAQLGRRLRADLSPLGLRIEQLTAAVDIDSFEGSLLGETELDQAFDVLIATPEKLDLVIRNEGVPRPLTLLVMDEAQTLEDHDRGLRCELLLATAKRDCPDANFLLLTPFVPNAEDLALWLAPDSGRAISLSASHWKANERIVGMYDAQSAPGPRGSWALNFEALATPRGTVTLPGRVQVGPPNPLDMPLSRARGLFRQTAAMAKVFGARGTSIAVARRVDDCWSMAKELARNLEPLDPVPAEIQLVQRFLETEVAEDYELVRLLVRGVGVHHAALSDEVRSLMEWLAEDGYLRALCATTTIAHGINFPVASVFMASRQLPARGYSRSMTPRAFWNLAGRAGRTDHDSVGVVGLAAGSDPAETRAYVATAIGDLISRLVDLLDELETSGRELNLELMIADEQWADFRSYVAHLWAQKRDLDAVLNETENLLRGTLGYRRMRASNDAGSQVRAARLLSVTREYARELAAHPERATLADATGFSPEGVRAAIGALNDLPRPLSIDDWRPQSLFGATGRTALASLIGVMLRVPRLRASMADFGSHGGGGTEIAEIAQAWVSGATVRSIAERFFSEGNDNLTDSISDATRAIYRSLSVAGAWGLAALSRMPRSGIDHTNLSPEDRELINSLPARLYHGVNTEEAVLLRMAGVPRSIATTLGEQLAQQDEPPRSPTAARAFLRALSIADWQSAAPPSGAMTGADYRSVWGRLSGEVDLAPASHAQRPS